MKKRFVILLSLIISFASFSQKQRKDTLQTAVVEISTTFNPDIADVKKIRNNPRLEFSKRTKKKKLSYNFFSAPVATTFIPKTGIIKKLDIHKKEQLYKNYIAAGFGNFNTPYIEAFLHSSARFNSEFGVNAKYLASNNNIQSTKLNSTYANFNAGAFYRKQDRYFNWKIGLQTERNNYNWYGLPKLNFTALTLKNIEETQQYNTFCLDGGLKFNDAYIDYINISFSNFTDKFNSNETRILLNSKLDYPLFKIGQFFNTSNEITLQTNVDYLKGSFEKSYATNEKIAYSIFTINLEPSYTYNYKKITINASLKTAFSSDSENSINDFFLLPNLHMKSKLYKQHVGIYSGFKSGLHTNTYQQFSRKNPFVSPTLSLKQTLEKSNYYIGFHGYITNTITYNIKTSTKNEKDKPLFLRNNSKSDGTTFVTNGNKLLGYEFGNSFRIVYDDVRTTTFFGELTYEFSENLSFNTQITYRNFKLTNVLSPWNLPSIKGVFSTNYKEDQWFANATIFYIDERTDAVYDTQFQSNMAGFQNLSGFVDVNINGGYHINKNISTFLNINNVLNNQYQRFANFNVQGFQLLAGITYKFDF